MTVWPVGNPRSRAKITLPTREEIKAMWTDPGTARLMIVCVTVIALVALVGLFYLASRGSAVEAVGAIIVGALGLVIREVLSMKRAVKDVQSNVKPTDQGGPQ